MFDVTVYCRTCMCELVGNNKINLKSYSINESLGLAQKLEQCSATKVHPYDGYPPKVCEVCFVKISDFHEFQHMCRRSLKRFVEILEEHKLQFKRQTAAAEISFNDEADENDKDVQAPDIESQCENVIVVDDDDPLIEIAADSVQLVGVNIERIDLNLSVGSKGNNGEMAVAGEIVQEKTIETICMEQESCANKNEEKISSPIGDTGETETLKEQITDETNASSSPDDRVECLTEEEEFVSDDCELYEKKETKTAPNKRLKCSICPKKFLLKHCLEGHMRTHQGLMDHPCPRKNCSRSYRRLCDLRQHLRDHDGLPREYRCARETCEQTFSRYGDLAKHRIEKHGAPELFTCEENDCDYECKTRTLLKRHMDKKHGYVPQKQQESHVCDTCGAVLRSAVTLRIHALIHVERSQWPFVCNVEGCSKRFRIQHQLNVHKNRHAGIKKYSCPHCDKTFVTSTNLKNHINTHTWERTWSCDFCPKVCNNPDILRKHVEGKHGIIKRFPCRICNRPFNSMNAKMYHEMTHVGDDEEAALVEEGHSQSNRFPCDYCDLTFEFKQRKQYHELSHTGEKPHTCDECGRGFKTKTLLKTHKRTHMKEPPRDYVCSVCDRAFFSAQSLRHHEMKHTKEKPYKCEECGFCFRWPNNLTRHRKLHLRDKQLSENTQEDESINVLVIES